MNTCKATGCGRPVLNGGDLCPVCDADFADYMRRREQKPTYGPVTLKDVDPTTPGQHRLTLDMEKEIKPLSEVGVPVGQPLVMGSVIPSTQPMDPVVPLWAKVEQKNLESAMTQAVKKIPASLAAQYPQYYKSVEGYDYIDTYAVHYLFDIQDPSGMLQHASKKLLLSGVRTGNKSKYKDIKEARDTLNRWLEINQE